MQRTLLRTLVLVALTAVALPALAEQSGRPATDYTFDGIRLGAVFQQAAMSKAPYQTPCDDDPIEDRSRTIVVYMGHECRGQTFPEGTTALFFLGYAEGDAKFSQPIQAIAWIGGTYFNTRTDFPARVGQSPAEVNRALGAPTSTFRLGGRRRFVTVRDHGNNVFSVVYESRVVAFVAGQMPSNHESESWGALLEMVGESIRR